MQRVQISTKKQGARLQRAAPWCAAGNKDTKRKGIAQPGSCCARQPKERCMSKIKLHCCTATSRARARSHRERHPAKPKQIVFTLASALYTRRWPLAALASQRRQAATLFKPKKRLHGRARKLLSHQVSVFCRKQAVAPEALPQSETSMLLCVHMEQRARFPPRIFTHSDAMSNQQQLCVVLEACHARYAARAARYCGPTGRPKYALLHL